MKKKKLWREYVPSCSEVDGGRCLLSRNIGNTDSTKRRRNTEGNNLYKYLFEASILQYQFVLYFQFQEYLSVVSKIFIFWVDVFLTVHHSIYFFQITNLMHNSFILQQYVCYTTILDMFRSARCSSSGGQIVSPQLLVSSPSVNSRTVCRWRADCSNVLLETC